MRIGSDLPPRDEQYSTVDVASSTWAVMAAIEAVKDRYVNYRALDTPTLIVDYFFHRGCVSLSQPSSSARP